MERKCTTYNKCGKRTDWWLDALYAQVTGGDGTIYTGTYPNGTPLVSGGQQERLDWNSKIVVAGAQQRNPVIPQTKAQCISYAKNAVGWNFYP